jgi:hypothetical protein
MPRKFAYFRENWNMDLRFNPTHESGNLGVQFGEKNRGWKSHETLPLSVTLNAGMPDCPASCQSGTGLKITNDAVHGPVPE